MRDLPAFLSLDDGAICCPTCGRETHDDNTCVHLGPVTVRQNGTETTVDRESDKVRAVSPSGRGSSVTIEMWCESGHLFDLQFWFHKGSTYLAIVPGEPFNPADETPAELWRD